MTASAAASPSTHPASGPAGPPERRSGFTLTADGSYGACLATDRDGNWYPERWTLHGPEPYTVPLPCAQPEEPDSSVLPLRDGRVLIRRYVGAAAAAEGGDGDDDGSGHVEDAVDAVDGVDGPCGRHTLALLHPSGPATTEQPLGSVAAVRLELVPPAPASGEVYGLAPAAERTVVWRVHGRSSEPERVAELPGRCAARGWLDPDGRTLAVDQELAGRTKAVTVDLQRDGKVSPLLQITEESNDRLLLADPDSGLLLLCSDAPGRDRLGWGVLGSRHPVRFPDALCPADAVVTPFAVQPGQVLMPEQCGVALRLDGPAGCHLGVWRPAGRRLVRLPPLPGWIAGTGRWTTAGELRLPYATAAQPCGMARLAVPDPAAPAAPAHGDSGTAPPEPAASVPLSGTARAPAGRGAAMRPVPLQEAPL